MSNPHFENAANTLNRANGEVPEMVPVFSAVAQVEATLAVAFETRTANLIAVQQHTLSVISGGAQIRKHNHGTTLTQAEQEAAKHFDNWLTQHDRQTKEQAWDEGQASGISFQAGAPYETNPYEKETK